MSVLFPNRRTLGYADILKIATDSDGSPDLAFSELLERTTEQLAQLTTESKEMIISSGMTMKEVSLALGYDASTICQSLRRGFGIPTEKLKDFCNMVWPRQLLDMLFYNELIPTELLPSDQLFLYLFNSLNVEKRTQIMNMMKALPVEPVNVFTRYNRLCRERYKENPTVKPFHITPQTISTLVRFRSGEPFRAKTAAVMAVQTGMTLDYFFGDYSLCDIRYTVFGEKNPRIPNKTERKALSLYAGLSEDNKSLVYSTFGSLQLRRQFDDI